ncbi:hypothetical protein [Streptacidiphilus sp. EB103A]|uniref:hypothetical protein n=1 Tax=Streptacidiphilus sp. EB103A TaxID=3156275 RepID=UPI003519C37C
MSQKTALRELRRLLDQGRWGLLDTSILLRDLEEGHLAEAEERLRAELRVTDEFAAPADHTDYKPE